MTFNEILDKYRQESFSERDKGDHFERLMQAYLQTDPKYSYLFEKVWMWNEFPGRDSLELYLWNLAHCGVLDLK